ncbi:MAG: FecR family protein [Pseudomonadota bacterium]
MNVRELRSSFVLDYKECFVSGEAVNAWRRITRKVESSGLGKRSLEDADGKPDSKNASVDLSDEAIEWLVYLHSDEASKEDHEAFSTWRALSDEHQKAALEAELIWQGIGLLGEENSTRKQAERKRLTRRAVLGGGITAVVGLAGYQSGLIGPHLFAQHATGTGERRSVHLDDGSTVHMNAETSLSTYFTAGVRRLVLFAGQAVFDVARDVDRPFIVEAGNGSTRALGTAFDVNFGQDSIVVTVLEGIVAVSSSSSPADYVTAEADQRLRYNGQGVDPDPLPVDAETELAWRRGKLIFDQKPLGEVINEIERQMSGRIVFANASARNLKVTGVFDLNEPQAVLEAIEYSLPVKVTRLPLVTILR